MTAINAYLKRDMLRQILTLLAIMTGLTALATPASSRVTGADSVQVETARERTAACEVRQYSNAAIPGEAVALVRQQSPFRTLPDLAVAIPCVHIGPDRARE